MTRIDYGWWVLLGLFLLYMATNGILLNTLPLLYPELTREFGWNEEQVTRPASLLLVLTALLTPLLGALCDRFPARRIMLGGVLLIVAPLMFYAYISSLSQMIVINLVCEVVLAACGLVPCMLILSRWLLERRGFAVGILLMGSSLGGALFPLLAKQSLAEQGWREAITLVTVVGGAMMFLGLALIRNFRSAAPGDAPPDAAAPALNTTAPESGPVGYTLREAAALPAFYLLMIATGALWFCIVGILQHQSIYLGQDLGVSNSLLPIIFSAFFWSAIAGKLIFGYLGDHFNKVIILVASIINLLLGLVVLRAADPDSNVTLFAYAVIYGVGFSGAFAAIQLVLAEFFAGGSYGRILGVFIMIDSFAGAAGIQFLGLRRVADGSYLPALGMLIGMLVVVTLLTTVLLRFQPRGSAAVTP
mgnify:FL=1